jgi:hypothetical protein
VTSNGGGAACVVNDQATSEASVAPSVAATAVDSRAVYWVDGLRNAEGRSVAVRVASS